MLLWKFCTNNSVEKKKNQIIKNSPKRISLQNWRNFGERVLSIFFPAPSPHRPPHHANFKANMAGQINNRELVKSICLSKTITLQVKSVLELSITAILNSLVILVARMALPSNLSEIIFFFCIKQGHIISLIIPCSQFLVLFCFVFSFHLDHLSRF